VETPGIDPALMFAAGPLGPGLSSPKGTGLGTREVNCLPRSASQAHTSWDCSESLTRVTKFLRKSSTTPSTEDPNSSAKACNSAFKREKILREGTPGFLSKRGTDSPEIFCSGSMFGPGWRLYGNSWAICL